jgi:hypothetical protein
MFSDGRLRTLAVFIGASLVGLILFFAVYLPAGEPDAAEVTFLLSLVTIGGGLLLGWVFWTGRYPRIGSALLGIGVGVAIGFVALIGWGFLQYS